MLSSKRSVKMDAFLRSNGAQRATKEGDLERCREFVQETLYQFATLKAVGDLIDYR